MDTGLAIIFATFVGPIFAVAVGWALQARDRRFYRRHEIFRTMMRTRRNWLNPEWVGALNLVQVEFAGNTEVITACERLLDAYASPGWSGTLQQTERAAENAGMAANELLQRMAMAVGVRLRGADLRRAYAPQTWATDEQRVRELQDAVAAVMQGRAALRVIVVEPPPTPGG
jgi:hypothetical protein